MENIDINHIRKIYKTHDYIQCSVLLFIILILFFYIIPREYSNGYTDDLIRNLSLRPLIDFEPKEIKIDNNTEKVFLSYQSTLGKWEGTVKSCNCLNSTNKDFNNKLFRKKCSKKMLKSNCFNLPKYPYYYYRAWKGIYLNPIPSSNQLNYIDYYQKYSYNGKCLNDLKDCGFLDSNFIKKLCLPSTFTCPINHIYIDNNENGTSDYNYKNIKLNNGYYLHYTNEKKDKNIIVEFKISELLPCANPIYDNRKEIEYELYKNDKYNCLDNIEDFRYTNFDYESKQLLYYENGINQVINELPLYNVKNTSIVQIFYRGYIGIETQIKFKQRYLTFYEYYKYNIYANNTLRLFLTFFIVVFIYLSIRDTNKRGGNVKIFKNDIAVRIIIEITIIILIYDSYIIYNYNERYYILLNNVNSLSVNGSKKICNLALLFSYLDIYLLCGLIFLLFYNPIFLLSEKIAKRFPEKKINRNINQNNNSSVAVDIIANQMEQNPKDGFDKIKQRNIEKEDNQVEVKLDQDTNSDEHKNNTFSENQNEHFDEKPVNIN